MLGLDVQEQSQLHSLESSWSNTVNHKWPILHVHFIDEPISNWDIKEQGDLTTQNQKHSLPQTDIVKITKFIQVPEQTSCQNYSLNSAAMLDTVERFALMDISSPNQTLDLQESAGSSAMQDRGDFLETCIHPEVSAKRRVKDNQTLSEHDKAAYVEDISTELVLHFKNAKLDNLQPERNTFPDIKESDSSGKLIEICSRIIPELQNSFEKPLGRHEECTVVMSSEQTCLSNDLREEGSCTCLEDQKVPLYSCTSHNMTKSPDAHGIQDSPVLCEEAFVCKESKCSDVGKISSAALLFPSSEGSMTENSTGSQQNSLVQNVAQSKDICVQQSLDTTSCTEGQNKKDCLCTHLSTTHLVGKVETSLEDVLLQNISGNLLSESGKCFQWTEAVTIQPNHQTSIDILSAKSCDTQDCVFVPNTREYNVSLQSVSAECHEDLGCSNNVAYKSDESSHSSSIDLVSIKSTFGESSCKDTSSNLEDNKTSTLYFRDSDLTGQEQEVEEPLFQVEETFMAEKVFIPKRGPSSDDGMMQETHCTVSQDNLPHILNGAQLPVTCYTTQMPELNSILPNLGCDTITSFKIVTSPDSVTRTKNGRTSRQPADSNLASEVSDTENANEMTKLDNPVPSKHSQSSESLAINKTMLSSDPLKEVNCQALLPECQSAADLSCPSEITPQNALVPYVDVWSFVRKPRLPDGLPLNNTSNMILKKAKLKKCQLRKGLSYERESSFLNAKAYSVLDSLPGWKDSKHALLVHSSAHVDSRKAHLLKYQDSKFKIPKSLFHGHHAWSHRVEKFKGIPSVVPTIHQAKWVSSSCSVAVNINNISACSPVGEIRSAEKLKCFTQVNDSCLQKMETLTYPTLSSSYIVQSTVLPSDILASFTNSEHTQEFKQVVPIKPMITRSRNKINCNGSTECLHMMKPVQPSISSKDPKIKMQSILVGEHRPPFKLLESKSLKRSPPEMAIGTLKRKRICINEKTLPTNIDKKPLPLQHGQQMPKDCLRQPTCCQMEMEVIKADKSIENCTLQLEPQSLTCTIQRTKRPKTSHKNFGQPSSSDLQGCIDTSSHETLSLHPHSLKPSKIQKDRNLTSNNYMTGDISLRRQPSRKCKSSFMQDYNALNSNMQTCKLSKAFHAHTRNISNRRLLPSKLAVPKTTSNTLYAEIIKRDVVTLKKCTAEQALLHQLSAIASRLTAPCKSSPRSTPLSNTTKLVPFRGVQLQARKLLNVFSCVNMKISSQSAGNMGFSPCLDHLSQRMDLCPADLAKVCPDILASSFSLPTFDNTSFPISFHMKIEPGFLSDFIKLSPPDYTFKSVLPITQSAQLSEWTLSFFLSPQFPATSDGIQLFTHWNPHFRCLGTSSKSCGRGKSDRKSGCSMLGLHTVLALSSPGCYRLWTRNRNLGSRIPTVQKLSVTQFAHGLKGLPPQFSWKRELSSSLAFSLGRVMSMWSRHGLSTLSSDFATPHPHCSSWQPNQSLSISVPVLRPSTDLIPKNCLRANEPRLQFNVSSWEEKYFRPPQCISALSNHASCLFVEENGGLGPSCSLFTKQSKDVKRPLRCLPDQRQANPFGLSIGHSRVFEPPQSLSIEQTNDLGHLNCLSIKQDDVLEPLTFLSKEQTNSLLPIDSPTVLSTEQGKEFEPSSYLSLPQQDKIKPTHSLPLDQVNGCGHSCQLSTEQGDGLRPFCSVSAEQGDGPGISYCVSIENGSGLGPLHKLSNKHQGGIKPLDSLIAQHDVTHFAHCLTIDQRMGLGLSEVLSSEQSGGLKTACFLPPQQANSLGPPLSLSTQKECEFAPCNLSILQDSLKPPSILIPSKTQARPFEQRESLPIPHAKSENQTQESEKEEGERKPQRVSQIRIRKTVPKPDPNLTPMGLPKPKRINKKEFSLEDIYTNKNYKSPPPARSLETIFEEPKEKNGVLVSVSQTKRKRILEFRDCTMPRPKRAKGKVKVMTTCKRGRKAAMEGVQLDALLIQKLMDLENFLLEQEALERGSAATEKPS